MFPLESAFLPGDDLPLRIFEPRYTALVRDCMGQADPCFGVVLISRGREVGGGDTRCDVGALAHITECVDAGSGRYLLRCRMGERIRVCRWLPDDPYPRAVVQSWPTSRASRSPMRSWVSSRTGCWRCSNGSRPPAASGRQTVKRSWATAGSQQAMPASGCMPWHPACRSDRPIATPCCRHRRRPSGWRRWARPWIPSPRWWSFSSPSSRSG
ncbi:ATP-dependent protease La domain protein [Mycobacterium xenopi 4042]|uniref:ATP-dependent protease La domain protein n=1 Tax=Mycobacterium xenopi 4042 TaxID=1299334 RepID=X8DJF9_MYCXE|nr:ATP-dependent protease La domain protein [Mycobacterium xenopi 4042]